MVEGKKGFQKGHKINLGRKRPDLVRKNLRNNPMKNKKIRRKMSETRKERVLNGKIKVWNKGIKIGKQSIELIKKRTEARRGYKNSKEHNIKISVARLKQILPLEDSSIEIKIQNFLKKLHIEFYTHFWVSKIENSYLCDIYIPSLKTIIECDGCYWHGCPICKLNSNDRIKEHKKRDKLRTKEIEEK